MRFVAVKSEDKQSSAMIFKARDLLVRQRTQTINALRGHLAEFGVIAPKGTAHLEQLIRHVEAPDTVLPQPVCAVCLMLIDLVRNLIEQIRVLNAEIRVRSRTDAVAKRLMTILGVGPIIATALASWYKASLTPQR